MLTTIILSISVGLNLFFIISFLVKTIRKKFEDAVQAEVNRRNDIKFAKRMKKKVEVKPISPEQPVSYRIPRGG